MTLVITMNGYCPVCFSIDGGSSLSPDSSAVNTSWPKTCCCSMKLIANTLPIMEMITNAAIITSCDTKEL